MDSTNTTDSTGVVSNALVSPVLLLMVSEDCGCHYYEAQRSQNIDDFSARIEQLEKDRLRWCIEDEMGDIKNVSSIHVMALATIAMLRASG